MNAILNISFDFDFLPLLILIAIAWSIPMFLTLLRLGKIPVVIVEIIAGYFIGKYLLQSASVESMQILEFLALSGFLFLMFLSGLEIDVDQLLASLPRKKLTYSRFLKNPLLVGFSMFIIALVLSYFSAVFLSYVTAIQHIWYFALIMVTTSVGIVLPVLKSSGEINSRFGQMVIIAAAIADIFSIILFTLTAFVIEKGFKLELLWILVLLVVFYIFYHIGKWLKNVSVFNKITFQLSHAASQIKFRGTMMLILVFVVMAQYIGKEVILLGAFLGGLLLSIFLHKERSLLIIKLDSVGFGFFIPIFFIMVGVSFQPEALLELDNSLYVFLFLLLIILFAVKVIPSFLWIRLFGLKKAISGGFLMASRLSLIIAASTIGLELGVISPGINACFILMAVLTCLFSPVVYNYLTPKGVFASEKTIIVGGSSTGVILARRMQMHNKLVVIIENNKKRYDAIKAKGIQAIMGDGTDASVFENLKLAPTNYVVACLSNHKENISVCEMLRHEFNHEKIIAKTGNSAIDQVYKSLEVERVDVLGVVATAIESLIVRPTTYNALVNSFENFSIEEIVITNSEFDGHQIKEIPFPKDGTILMIKRGDSIYVPKGDIYLRRGDILNVFGTDAALSEIKNNMS